MTLQTDIPLAPFTTIGLGGRARFFASCPTETDLREALKHGRDRGLPVHVLGGGSNTIFDDEGFAGLVLQVSNRGIHVTEQGTDVLVRAAAGEPWDPFVHFCIERGLGGLECLSGIPGSVGATPLQNVGAYGQEVAETILTVEAMDRISQRPQEFSCAECGFGYRTSRFKEEERDRYLITSVTFRLTPRARPSLRYPELQRSVQRSVDLDALGNGRPALTAVRNAVLGLRRSKSMVIDPADPDSRSVGSFFTNPVLTRDSFRTLEERWKTGGRTDAVPHFPAGSSVKVPAAWLVEQAGFPKGFRKGNVGISKNHALALVNRGGTSAELLTLAAEIENAVSARFGVRLVREPVIVQSRMNNH